MWIVLHSESVAYHQHFKYTYFFKFLIEFTLLFSLAVFTVDNVSLSTGPALQHTIWLVLSKQYKFNNPILFNCELFACCYVQYVRIQ